MFLNTMIALVILGVLYGMTWHNQPARRPFMQRTNPHRTSNASAAAPAVDLPKQRVIRR
jgi:hypothetical protein